MVKIINFSGPQGSGKTTMKDLVVEYLEDKGKKVLSNYVGVKKSISRDAAEEGFVINEMTNFDSQYYIAAKYIVADILTRKTAVMEGYDFIVLDRSVLDVIPYTRLSKNILVIDQMIIESMLTTHFDCYPVDLMVYTKPIDSIEDDGVRSTNVEFMKGVNSLFGDMYEKPSMEYRVPKKKMCMLENDSIESRLSRVVYKVADLIE